MGRICLPGQLLDSWTATGQVWTGHGFLDSYRILSIFCLFDVLNPYTAILRIGGMWTGSMPHVS